MILDRVSDIVIAVFVCFSAVIVGKWVADNDAPIKILEDHVLTPKVKPGERLVVHFTLDRRRADCSVVINRYIFDGMGVRITVGRDSLDVNPGDVGRESIAEAATIPPDAAPGKARFRVVRTYRCNPWHRVFDNPIIVRMDDVSFEIVP